MMEGRLAGPSSNQEPPPRSGDPVGPGAELRAGLDLLRVVLASIQPGMSSQEAVARARAASKASLQAAEEASIEEFARLVLFKLAQVGGRGAHDSAVVHPAIDEQRFRQLAESSAVMMWMSDAEYRCVYVNRAWEKFRGKSMDQAQGYGWKGSIHPDDLPRLLGELGAAARELRSSEVEYRARRHDGEDRWLLSVCQPRFGPDGGFEGFVGRSFDITHR